MGRCDLSDGFSDCEQMALTIYGFRTNMNSLFYLIEMMSFHIIKLILWAYSGIALYVYGGGDHFRNVFFLLD